MQQRVPIPVIVVGNINVGGTGKTPLVIWLARFLQENGFSPGIISRGYRGTRKSPGAVLCSSDPADVGDEPVLIAKKVSCPIWIGADRTKTARALVAANPQCNVLISDDGLQHYRLHRDIELAIVDGDRQFGNRLMLPAGPLRENISRLKQVDAVVVNGHEALKNIASLNIFHMLLHGTTFYNLSDRTINVPPTYFSEKKVHAVAGIGNPDKFFALLRTLGLTITAHPFPDHYKFRPDHLEFSQAEAIVMTEKDAVKCEHFAETHYWALSVEAQPDLGLGKLILEKLRNIHGRKAT